MEQYIIKGGNPLVGEVEIGADSVADWLRETLEEQTPGLADSVSWVDVLRAGPKRLAIVALRDGRRLALKLR